MRRFEYLMPWKVNSPVQKLSIQAKFEVLNIVLEKSRGWTPVRFLIVPRSEQPIKNLAWYRRKSASVYRAAQLEVPMFLGILGSTPEHCVQYCHAYRGCMAKGRAFCGCKWSSVAVHGFVGDKDREAKKTYLEHEIKLFQTGSAECYCNCCFFV